MPQRRRIENADDLPDVCTPQVAADYLGISRGRVYEYCLLAPSANGIPSYQIGGSRKIDKTDLLKWKESQKQLSLSRFAQ
jgi:excisionase family DNA binding protein